MPFLHGVLFITIHEAKDLPDADRAFFNVGKDYSDPYVTVDLGAARILKTSIIDDNLNPKWGEKFRRDVAHDADNLEFRVKDKDFAGVGVLGTFNLSVGEVMSGDTIEGWYPLENSDDGAEINIEVQFQPADTLDKTIEVPNTYFPVRSGCRATLYQDAHTPPHPLHEEIVLDDGSSYSPHCSWREIHEAISNAQHLIYLTGWSVYTATRLLREEDDDKVTVGEMIQQKASDGVRVLGLVWNEKLSTDITPGLMGTHDEETLDFFEGSDVEMVLVERQKDKGSFLEHQFVSTCYSHHQKSVILDVEDPEGDGRRRIVAFVGGLDLTDGRWDTPEHHLFSTLTKHHDGDFYNKCVAVDSSCGPREPWHDIHCKLEGQAALDVHQNFVERWRKQAEEMEGRLYTLTEDEFNLEDPVPAEHPWSVQLFRSINCDSANFDSDAAPTLTRRKGRAVDDSIHRAYVHHIRRAQNYIYIENQYFLGSAYAWDEPRTKANHLIPLEIANRVCEKIAAGEPFGVYIIVPMYPEGDPNSSAVQEILSWQTRTMRMMYQRVARAIEEHGAETHPTDYLNFFCLGKREAAAPEDLPEPEPETPSETLRNKLRFMIYVHSKMMIVDDEYCIIGSANINQRSMGGNRDSEIAMGAFQDEYTMEACGGLPKGEVFGFRMALWAEHLAQVDELFQDPGSLECVQKVKEIAQENLDIFLTEDPSAMEGYLLRYPVHIRDDGWVESLPDCEEFPDIGGNILGTKNNLLPDKLTT